MGIYPESGPPRQDITCDTCTAACCRAGMLMGMTKTEAFNNTFKIRREVLHPASPRARTFILGGEIRVIPADYEISILEQDCGHLTADNRCAVFDSPTRPNACVEFEPGSEACIYAREKAGIIDPPQI